MGVWVVYVCDCVPFPPSQLATGLTSLAESFDKFHETGLLHFQAATAMIQSLQNIAGLCQNDSGSTLSSHILMVGGEVSTF